MKKLISILLTGVMLLSLVTVSVNAEIAADTAVISGTIAGVWEVSNTGLTEDIANFQLSTENVSTGQYSLRLQHLSGKSDTHTIAIKFPVTLEVGKTYRINFRSTEIFGNGAARQRLIIGPSASGFITGCKQFSNSDGVTSIATDTVNNRTLSGSKTWRTHTFDYTAVGTSLYLLYIPEKGDGNTYFDNFNISEVNGGTLTPLIIPNGDFECYEDSPVISGELGNGWIVSKADRGSGNLTADVANFQLSTVNKVSGTYSLRMNKPVTTMSNSNLAVKFPVTLENGESYTIKFKTTMDSIGSGGGARPYIYIGPVKNNENTSNANCHYFSSSTAGYTTSELGYIGNRKWRYVTCSYTTPAENGENLFLVLNVANSRSDIDVYFDDFEITKVSDGSNVHIHDWDFEGITMKKKYTVTTAEKFDEVTFSGGFSSTGEGSSVQTASIGSISNGNIMGSMSIKNQTNSVLSVHYILAVYKDGSLDYFADNQKNIAVAANETLNACANISDKDNGVYEIKTFLWEDRDNAFWAMKHNGILTE